MQFFTFFTIIYKTFFTNEYSIHQEKPCAVHKASLNKYRRTEITQSMFSKHDGIKLEIHQKEKSGKLPNMWKLNNTFLNNPLV